MRRSSFEKLDDSRVPPPEEEDGVFPIRSRGNSPTRSSSKKAASKLSCAFQALQCSSPAKEEENIPTLFYPEDDGSFPLVVVEPDHSSSSAELDQA
jgi:galactose-1-phosphate uridylyltransferase